MALVLYSFKQTSLSLCPPQFSNQGFPCLSYVAAVAQSTSSDEKSSKDSSVFASLITIAQRQVCEIVGSCHRSIAPHSVYLSQSSATTLLPCLLLPLFYFVGHSSDLFPGIDERWEGADGSGRGASLIVRVEDRKIHVMSSLVAQGRN